MRRIKATRCFVPILSLLLSCATQRERRVSTAEARERPSDESCEEQGVAPFPGAVWACGYWHWDSVRYVRVPGRWERR